MQSKSLKIKSRYNRYSYLYDILEYFPEKLFFRKIRNSIIPDLKGKVLEIGVGTGKNLPYYPKDVQVTAIDFSDKMLVQAERKLKKLNRNNISLKKADVENLPFLDNSFDMVITTFVFCSVPNPIKGFEEIKRVLKEDGEAVFIEHVKSENRFYQTIQNIFNPVTVAIFGFNINRDTKENIQKGGLKVKNDINLAHHDIFRKFICSK